MSMTMDERHQLYTSIYDRHMEHWDSKKDTMEMLMDAYNSEFWKQSDYQFQDYERRVETPHAYTIMGQYKAALISKDPAVAVGGDSLMQDSQEKAEVIEALVNRWLPSVRTALENGTLQGLIYPSAFLRVFIDTDLINDQDPASLLDAPCVEAIPAWEGIVDTEATSIKSQRFMGHLADITLDEVKSMFNKRPTGLLPKKKQFYFDKDKSKNSNESITVREPDYIPPSHQFIRLVELYDYVMNTRTVFTTDHEQGYYEFFHSDIPVRSSSKKPLANVIPFYLDQRPDKPMIGISTMKRIYSLLKELNDLRTHMANITRGDIRQILYDRSRIDANVAEAVQTSGIDRHWIGVKVNPGQSLRDIIYDIPVQPVGSNFREYENSILSDLSTSTLFAPFSRGEVTKATATEIGVLSQYTASEEGRLRRIKNSIIEALAEYYVRWLAVQFADIDTPIVLPVTSGEAKYINAKTFEGKYTFTAIDESATPISSAYKNQQFLELVPILKESGVSSRKILEEVVRRFNLPEALLEVEELPVEEAQPLVDQSLLANDPTLQANAAASLPLVPAPVSNEQMLTQQI